MKTRLGAWLRRFQERRLVQRRLVALREEAAAEATQLTPLEAKVLWLVADQALERPPLLIATEPQLRAALERAFTKLHRIYRGYGPEPRRAA